MNVLESFNKSAKNFYENSLHNTNNMNYNKNDIEINQLKRFSFGNNMNMMW